MWSNSRRRRALDLHELHTALLMLEKAATEHLSAAVGQPPTESDVRQLQSDVKARARRVADVAVQGAADRAAEACDPALDPGIRDPSPDAFERRESARKQIEEAMLAAREPILDRIEVLTTRWLRPAR